MTNEIASSSVEELEQALCSALQARHVKPTQTYWVKAVMHTRLGFVEAKVAFTQALTVGLSHVECSLVLPSTPGWNFSSPTHAQEMAEFAAGKLELALGPFVTLQTEVVTE